MQQDYQFKLSQIAEDSISFRPATINRNDLFREGYYCKVKRKFSFEIRLNNPNWNVRCSYPKGFRLWVSTPEVKENLNKLLSYQNIECIFMHDKCLGVKFIQSPTTEQQNEIKHFLINIINSYTQQANESFIFRHTPSILGMYFVAFVFLYSIINYFFLNTDYHMPLNMFDPWLKLIGGYIAFHILIKITNTAFRFYYWRPMVPLNFLLILMTSFMFPSFLADFNGRFSPHSKEFQAIYEANKGDSLCDIIVGDIYNQRFKVSLEGKNCKEASVFKHDILVKGGIGIFGIPYINSSSAKLVPIKLKP